MLTIGEFAAYGRVSVRMLRHYDAIGLLTPAHVDPVTGYRSYEAAQLALLNRVIALRELGVGLTEIREIAEQRLGTEELLQLLRERRDGLRAALARVEARIRTIENEGPDPDMSSTATTEVVLKPLPAMRVAELTAVARSFEPADITPVIAPLYDELVRRLEAAGVPVTGPGLARYEDTADGEGIVVHAGLSVSVAPDAGYDFEVVDVPPVAAAATAVHRGSMDEVLVTAQAIVRWTEANGHRPLGYTRELYLDSCGPQETWVTELQQPVAG